MAVYFGTDGIRGVVNESLTPLLAFKTGNALANLEKKPLVVIGRDTRTSGDMLKLSLAAGITSAGGSVIDCMIMPTAGIAYLTKYYKADFGVVISASHNPKEFNGIKIFDNDGYKLGESKEELLESYFNSFVFSTPSEVGSYKIDYNAETLYIKFLCKTIDCRLEGIKIVLDCSNGAAYKIAPKVFTSLGAEVIAINCEEDGKNINNNCGSLHPQGLAHVVVEKGAMAGFAYDGDSDRLIACDEMGNIIDGDRLIYAFAVSYKEKGILTSNTVVGTLHTNMGVEFALKEKGIKLLRSDIGDKYVMELMKKSGAVIGGEQSGHIIFGNLATTGDGILSSLQIAKLICDKPIDTITKVKLFPQINANIKVVDKHYVLGSEKLSKVMREVKEQLENKGRVVVRASGTEPLIRVFVESEDESLSKNAVTKIVEAVKNTEAE